MMSFPENSEVVEDTFCSDEFSDYDDELDEILENFEGLNVGVNKHTQPLSNTMMKFENHLLFHDISSSTNIDHAVVSRATSMGLNSKTVKNFGRDRKERATAEEVIDKRTRFILYKLVQKENSPVSSISGCLSSGKEAHVYYGVDKCGRERAVKVYFTSILKFRAREQYVTGEFRFRNGYCRQNPRKMAKTWAEKEFRNLNRIYSAGITCPEPLLLKCHVLVMQFVGAESLPAPLLQHLPNTEISSDYYRQAIIILWRMYREANLVHGDFSEFNLLVWEKKLWVIDVSQAVEHDHPRALYFLRRDCDKINKFFGHERLGIRTLTNSELFSFITDPNQNNTYNDFVEDQLNELLENASQNILKKEDVAFLESYIPYRLRDVISYERDASLLEENEFSHLNYARNMTVDAKVQNVNRHNTPSDSESSSEYFDALETPRISCPFERRRDESPTSHKNRKKLVKEMQRERRKNKLPKHIKKRKIKLAHLKNDH